MRAVDKDAWLILAAAASRTERVRLGPCVAPIFMRDPTYVAQLAATLDELSGGRAEVVYGIGNIANDVWLEQVAERGWTSWTIPSSTEPALTWTWLAVLLATPLIWLAWFRQRARLRRRLIGRLDVCRRAMGR